MFIRKFLSWFLSLIGYSLILLIVDKIFEGFIVVDFETAFLTSFIISILNFFIRPIIVFLTLPITIITFGLFLVVINTSILLLVAKLLSPDFSIDGFPLAFIASILIAIMNLVLSKILIDGFRK